MSDVVIVSMISCCTAVLVAWIGVRVHDMARVVDQVHNLVNSAMTAQLRLAAVALRRIAMITRDPADEEAAKVAEQALRDNLSKGV